MSSQRRSSSSWKAVGELWPAALGQRCTIHALRNVTSKLPERHHDEVKAHWWKIFDEARSTGEARQQSQALASEHRAALPIGDGRDRTRPRRARHTPTVSL